VLSDKEVARFQREGCFVAPKVISDADVEELRGELDRVIATHQADGFKDDQPRPVMIGNLGGKADQVVWQIVNIWEASPAFERLLYLKPVVEALHQLTGEPDLQIWHDQIQYKPPRHGGINNWHQDAPYWPIIKPETPVTAWIALDDVDESNGCMWMVPGSHKWGNHIKMIEANPHDKFFEIGKDFSPPADAEICKVELRPTPVRKGEVSFHHSMTWHGSHKNDSDRPRRAIAIHVMTGKAVFVANGQHPMKKFVQVDDGEPMSGAGEHFPHICKGGKPVEMPQRLLRIPVQ
jgi:ectoine hydroxylase-related dioxygenase (phytanoyl-CoA dioxygenase family)